MDLMLGTIPPLPAQPRTKGALLTTAMPGSTPEGVDWHQGIAQWPESAPSWRIAQACTDSTVGYGNEAEFGPVAARPFVIQTVTHCPRGPLATMVARAERNLRAVTSTAMAHELWTGEASALDPWTLPTGQVALANPRGTQYLDAPTGVTATPSATGGTLAAGTRFYEVSATNAQGETLPSTQVSSGALTGTTSSVALTWTAVSGATGYRVYRTTTSGSYTSPALLASVTTTSYTDTGGSTSAGAPATTDTASYVGTADTGPYLNPHLTAGSGTLLTPTVAPDLQEAIGLVEAEVADRVAGGPIFLHVPSTHLLSLLALQHEGDLLRTPLGSYVVADTGYPPDVTDATDADLTVYGTGPVQYWLDEPVVTDRASWVVDNTTNKVAVWAERSALLLFDPQTLVGCTVTG